MIDDQIENKIILSIKKFYQKDFELLNYETEDPIICERTVTHKLGCYLQKLFERYNVDCEYNRHLKDIKKLEDKNIFPDIVIHTRKTDDYNLVWIEVKKGSGSEEEKNHDREKLKKVTALNGEYCYKYGIFIIIREEKVTIEIYKNGSREKILTKQVEELIQ